MPQYSKESVAFTRYQDESMAPDDQLHIFQHPKGEPLRRTDPGALFRMHKPEDHWETLRRSKSYIADSYFPPVALRSGSLKEMFEQNEAWRADPESQEFAQWKDSLIDMIPKLNFDAVIELALYLSLEAKVNDKYIWRAVENAALENLHLYELKHTCQMQWAVTQLKPKFTSARFDTLLFQSAREKVESGAVSVDDFHHIMQGHRNKKSKDMYLKMKKVLIDGKDKIIPRPQAGGEKKWAETTTDLFYSFASNKPRDFGVYKQYAKDEIRELIALYEHDFMDIPQHLDAEHLTRFAQVMYLLKDETFENIWWRIENRVHELAEQKGALDTYHVVNILRSFSKSQQNKMAGSPKLFVHLEPFVIKSLGTLSARDLSHVAFAYSARN